MRPTGPATSFSGRQVEMPSGSAFLIGDLDVPAGARGARNLFCQRAHLGHVLLAGHRMNHAVAQGRAGP